MSVVIVSLISEYPSESTSASSLPSSASLRSFSAFLLKSLILHPMNKQNAPTLKARGQAAGTLVPVPKLRALSVGAFCLFIGWSIKDFNKNAEKLLKLAEDGNEEAEVLSLGYSLIKETITTDMDESALSGLVDANYMAKLRGLRDLKDVTSNGKEAGTKAMQVNVLSEDAVNNLKKLGAI